MPRSGIERLMVQRTETGRCRGDETHPASAQPAADRSWANRLACAPPEQTDAVPRVLLHRSRVGDRMRT